MPSIVDDEGHNEWYQHGDFERTADAIERPIFFSSADAETKENNFESSVCSEKQTAAIHRFVEVRNLSNNRVLPNLVSNF